MQNLKFSLAIVAVVCFVLAAQLIRMTIAGEAGKNFVTKVPMGEDSPQAQIMVNTDKLCYFELSRSIHLTTEEPNVLGDVATSDTAPRNPLGRVIPIKYTVFYPDGQEIISVEQKYSVSEFNLKSPVSVKLLALQRTELGQFVRIKHPGEIWVQTSIIESDVLTGLQLQSTYGGVSVWDNALRWQGEYKIGALILISAGLMAIVWILTELLKNFLP